MSRLTRSLPCVLVSLLIIGCAPDPQSDSDIEARSRELLLNGDWQEAETLARRAVAANPKDPELRVLYADIALATGEPQNAEIAYRRAIELGADPAGLNVSLARALLMQNDFRGVLDFTEASQDISEAEQSELAVIRLRAEVGLGVQDATELRRRGESVVRSLDSAREGGSWPQPLLDELEELGEENTLVAAAIDHARCLRQPAEGYNASVAAASVEEQRNIIRVGPDRPVKTPTAAAEIAEDRSVIAIDAARYPGAVARWPQDDLTIVGVGGRPHIEADGQSIDGRDIWLFTGDNIVVENMEFSGARSSTSFNGAGIRHTGSNLTVRHSYFHDSDNGILTWKSPDGVIIIEYSEFARNGYGDGQSHNVYVGETGRLEFRYNYSHAAREGHLLKSRARVNDIRYNRLTGEEGEVSYVVNLPNGGTAYIVGNVIEKAVVSSNPYVISFGEEGLKSAENRLFVINNSVYNRYDKTILLRNAAEQPAVVLNNLLGGATMTFADGEYESDGNLAMPEHGMRDPRSYDFELTETAPAIDAGIAVAEYGNEGLLIPSAEYAHPVSRRDRNTVHRVDVGAHEYCAY